MLFSSDAVNDDAREARVQVWFNAETHYLHQLRDTYGRTGLQYIFIALIALAENRV